MIGMIIKYTKTSMAAPVAPAVAAAPAVAVASLGLQSCLSCTLSSSCSDKISNKDVDIDLLFDSSSRQKAEKAKTA